MPGRQTTMSKIILCFVILGYSVSGYSQRERVHLDLDKYTCKAGDTIWFKGYVFQGPYPSAVSTNLYVEVFSGQGILVQWTLWPVVQGQSPGQLILPDSLPTDNYYIVALTKQQLNYDTLHFFSVPVVVYNKERPNPIHHKKQFPNPVTVTAGVIRGVYWVTVLNQGRLSSMLELDSGSDARKFRVLKSVSPDSILAADIGFDSTHRWKYADFPADTTRLMESLFLYEDTTLIGRQVIPVSHEQTEIRLTPDTLDTNPGGYNSWDLKLPDSVGYGMSITVTDADRSVASPATIDQLAEAYTDDLTVPNRLVDSSYISFTGKATKENYLFGGKKIKDPFSREIVMTGVRDSNFVFIKTAKIDDDGNFMLDSLFFFGPIDLQFQINKDEDGSTKNIHLTLAKFVPPAVDSSCFNDWVDDEIPIGKVDTFFTNKELSRYERSKIKTLKAAVVKAWKSHRNELDNRYTTGPFSEPAMYSFDLRTYDNPYVRDLGSFLARECPGLTYDPTTGLVNNPGGGEIHYYVDQIEYDAGGVQMFDFDRIAYVKVLESDWLSTARPTFTLTGASSGLKIPVSGGPPLNILIYLRKDRDFRTMRGGLNKIAVKGYDKILPFKTDNVTLLWDPWAAGNEYRIRFVNNETTRRFRVKVEGISYTGKIIHYETVIE
jgi:hypothetical protein